MRMDQNRILELKKTALEVRKDVVRMIGLSRASNLGFSLSVVDILTVLYFYSLSLNPEDPKWPERDRLILGKSDAAPALYAVLARKGFFDREELWSYRKLGAMLQGTLDARRTPGVEAPGIGPGLALGIANGVAAACRADHSPARVFCFIGDDELREGSIWESVQAASALRLGNLAAIAEVHDREPGDGKDDIGLPKTAAQRFEAFGWKTIVCDGHSAESLAEAFSLRGREKDYPLAVIAKTRWGKGISSLENRNMKAPIAPNRERVENALLELEKEGKRLAEEMEE